MSAFELLSEPIRRYIYDKRWRDLRPIQTHAIQKIMGDERNYILVSPTASGKTEAAFLPVLSKIDVRGPASHGRLGPSGAENRVHVSEAGDFTAGEIPVPIPNTEVKPRRADCTARESVWESRSSPT